MIIWVIARCDYHSRSEGRIPLASTNLFNARIYLTNCDSVWTHSCLAERWKTSANPVIKNPDRPEVAILGAGKDRDSLERE